MNNQIDKAVAVDLGHAEVSLKFDWNAIAALEEYGGLTAIMGAKQKDGSVIPGIVSVKPATATRILVWAGVQHQMPGLSLQDIGNMMDMENSKAILDAIVSALSRQTKNPNPNATADGESDPNAPTTKTGS